MVLDALTKLETGFEGAEKRLELHFDPIGDLRRISRSDWTSILREARCTILSELSSKTCTSYLLSESSLFVFKHKILLKTCGTTTLLRCLEPLLAAAAAVGSQVEFVQFSRSDFLFPDVQPYPHCSFDAEVDYLNTFFAGQAYILGPVNGPRWHLYVGGVAARANSESHSLEIVMFNLDPAVMARFCHPEKGSGEAETEALLSQLLPGFQIDGHMFSPCGYSCNALAGAAPGQSYYTIHVTPEPECSFVSFETNVDPGQHPLLVQRVLELFRPAQALVAMFLGKSRGSDAARLFSWTLPGFECTDRAHHKCDGAFSVTMANFARTEVPAWAERFRASASPQRVLLQSPSFKSEKTKLESLYSELARLEKENSYLRSVAERVPFADDNGCSGCSCCRWAIPCRNELAEYGSVALKKLQSLCFFPSDAIESGEARQPSSTPWSLWAALGAAVALSLVSRTL